MQRTRDKFHQNAAHTRQFSAKCSTRGKFQESGMPECPNRMPECPNRTVHTSFQECSNQTDYTKSAWFKSGNDPSVSIESTWFLSEDMWMTPTDLQTLQRFRSESVQPKKLQWRLNAIRIEEIVEKDICLLLHMFRHWITLIRKAPFSMAVETSQNITQRSQLLLAQSLLTWTV